MSSNLNTSLERRLAQKTSSKNQLEAIDNKFVQETKKDSDLAKVVKQLAKVLEQHRGEKQIVVIQDFPDPDALSSAWAYQLIAANYDISCDIVYGGTLSHQENIALVRLTALPAKRYIPSTLQKQDLAEYKGCVLVDSQGTNSQLYSVVEEAGIPLVVVVDHHSKQGDLKAEFVDLRPQTRATATILTQYIQSGMLDFDSSN
ncbi:MAG: DHH family phosphoesterase, partial [Cyanobacteria bacterium J06621_12]